MKKNNLNLLKMLLVSTVSSLAICNVQAADSPNFLTDLLTSKAGSKVIDDTEGKDVEKLMKENQCVQHYNWGAPRIKDKEVKNRSLYLCRSAFALQFDPKIKMAIWSSEQLSKRNYELKQYAHEFKYQPDEDLPKKMQEKPQDYIKSKYFPQQLASINNIIVNNESVELEDLKAINMQAMKESFYFSNTVPMVYNNLVNTIWADLEATVTTFAKKSTNLYVTTGIIFLDNKNLGTLPQSGAPIPTHFYKIMTDPQTYGTATYIIPNKEILTDRTKKIDDPANIYKCNGGPCSLSNFLVPIKELERIINVEFFPKLAPVWSTQIKLDIGEMYKKQKLKQERKEEIEKSAKTDPKKTEQKK